MGLSIRAYARHRGVSHVAVKKAIDTGRITPLPDGTLDPEIADAQWAKNTLSRKAAEQPSQPARPSPARTSPARTSPASRSPEVPDPAQSLPSGGASLLQARTANEVLKARLKQIALAEKKEELVDRAKAVAQVFKLARSERDAWLNWPARVSAQMASSLGVDAHTMHVALEAAVREHLIELGELRPRVD